MTTAPKARIRTMVISVDYRVALSRGEHIPASSNHVGLQSVLRDTGTKVSATIADSYFERIRSQII